MPKPIYIRRCWLDCSSPREEERDFPPPPHQPNRPSKCTAVCAFSIQACSLSLTKDKTNGWARESGSRVPCESPASPCQACLRGKCGCVWTSWTFDCRSPGQPTGFSGYVSIRLGRPGRVLLGTCMHDVSIYVGYRHGILAFASSPPSCCTLPVLQPVGPLDQPLYPSVLQNSYRIFIVS